MSVLCEAIAASALREWLLLKLPAKVAEVNAARAATLRAPFAGPYVIPPESTLGINTTAGVDSYTAVTLTSGTRTATQISADLTSAGFVGVGSEDSSGRLVLTSPTPPSAAGSSVVRVRAAVSADANTILGWDVGGAQEVRTAHTTPSNRMVMDGWPIYPDFGSASDAGTPVVVVIGDRDSVPCLPGPRIDEYNVTLDVTVLRAEGLEQQHRTREAIQSALRCVRECLLQDAGRNLGRGGQDIQLVTEKSARISGQPFSFGNSKSPNPLYDAAQLVLVVRVFERPAAT